MTRKEMARKGFKAPVFKSWLSANDNRPLRHAGLVFQRFKLKGKNMVHVRRNGQACQFGRYFPVAQADLFCSNFKRSGKV